METGSRVIHRFSNVWQKGVNENEAVFVFSRELGTKNLQHAQWHLQYPNTNEIWSRSWMHSKSTVIWRLTMMCLSGGEWLVVPNSLRQDLMRHLNYSHSEVVCSFSRASIYWPNMSSDIQQFIEAWNVCKLYDKNQPKETLIPHEAPDRPWAEVGIDLFSYGNRKYLVCVDYYPSFWKIDLLKNTR